jgi:hypothetical protein
MWKLCYIFVISCSVLRSKGTLVEKGSYFSCLWLYSPILYRGRLHETFCFISVISSRTVGRRDSLDGWSARCKTSADCPGWLWWWRSWWNEQFWQGTPKYVEKTCHDATLSTTNPTCQTREITGMQDNSCYFLMWEKSDVSKCFCACMLKMLLHWCMLVARVHD